MTTEADALQAIAAWPRVEDISQQAREACAALRWHQALRRRIPEAAAESRVRGAHASAELDGARTSLSVVRDLIRGAIPLASQQDPAERTVLAAVQVTAESEHVAGLLRSSGAQALARLHVAAGSPLVQADQVGRPRQYGEYCGEFAELGPALPTAELPARLAGVFGLLSRTDLPALVVAALVHAEVVVLRPFVRGNGLVARALERAVVISSGLDPTGVAVPEAGHLAHGHTAYIGALTAYLSGSREGLTLWLRQCGLAVIMGAQEGSRIADAVLVGRLS